MKAAGIIWLPILCCCVLFALPCRAQETIRNITYTISASTNLDEIPLLAFQPADTTIVNRKWPHSVREVWMRFQIKCTGEDSFLVINSGALMPLFYLYRLQKNQLVRMGASGYELPYSNQSIPGDNKRIRMTLSKTDSVFFICFQRYHERMQASIPFLQTYQVAGSEFGLEQSKMLDGKIFQLFLGGFFLAIFIYSLLKYFSQSQDTVYLYYALVNFFCCLGDSIYYHIPNLESSVFPWLKNNHELCAIFSDTTIIFNIAFLTAIMNLKLYSSTLYRIVLGYIFFHVIATIVVPVMASNPDNLLWAAIGHFLYPVCELLCLFVYVLFVIHLWSRRSGYYLYLFYGCLIMTLGMLLFTLSSIFRTHEAFISKDGSPGEYVITLFFVISQVCFFIMALTQREKQTELNNANYQRELIAQLSAGKILQENFTRDLEKQVAERSEQIRESQALLDRERREKLVAVMNRRILETEMKALRSQMNPHFIFNSLNSIENFMMKNDRRMASDYMGKFATLIRMILDSSKSDQVSFSKDVEALHLYVELEQLRFDNRFTYKSVVDPVLLLGDFNVPSLLIQPYVENAILHGLAQSDKKDLCLQVGVTLEGDYLVYVIEDNGIGREKAESYRKNKRAHKSLGMQITQERIGMNNQHPHVKGNIEISDLFDDQQQACGTRVLVRLQTG